MKDYVPVGTDLHIKSYMSTKLFGSSEVIPLWTPSPRKGHPRSWQYHLHVGDAGMFNKDGGFDTLFNIFHSAEENRSRGYDPPPDFRCYSEDLSGVAVDCEEVTLPKPSKSLHACTLATGFEKKTTFRKKERREICLSELIPNFANH